MSERLPIILDVDTGIDDAAAIALAVRMPEVEILALTTLAGNVGVEQTTANTLAVLDWLGHPEIPVHRGASRPLVRPHVDAQYFHDANGLGGAELPTSSRAVGGDRGPAAIVRLAKQRPGEITLVCVGPLTNLAIALNVQPDLGSLLRSVVLMGGAFAEPGNITPHAEFNIYADPEAALQVFQAGLPDLTAVGLDVTRQTVLTRAEWDEAGQQGADDPAARLVVEVFRAPFLQKRLPECHLHDPLAVAAACWPDLLETESAAVMVGTSGAETGKTTLQDPGVTRVAREVDSERFRALFRERTGLEPVGPARV